MCVCLCVCVCLDRQAGIAVLELLRPVIHDTLKDV